MEFGVGDAAAEAEAAPSTADFTSWVLITPSESAANYSTPIKDDYIIVPGAATPKIAINSTEEDHGVNHHRCESKVSSPFENLHILQGVSEPLSIQDPDSSACSYNYCANDSPYISTMDPDHEERMSLRSNHEDEDSDEVEDAVLSINDTDNNINYISARTARLNKYYVNWKMLIRQWSIINRMQELSEIYKKRFAGLIYICKSKCCMLLSIGLGAALMGVLMLSTAWRRLRAHNTILKMQLYAKDKKMSQLVFQILQMREFMSHAKRVPVIVAGPDLRIRNFE